MRSIGTVLLIDDDPTEAALVEYGIGQTFPDTRFSYEQDSRKAIARIRSEHPDIVLLDLFMPSPDGFAVADSIHTEFGRKAPTVIVFSSTVDDMSDVAKSTIWADACMRKPSDPSGYPSTLSAALEFWRRTGHSPRTPVRTDEGPRA